jgi:hypothetical protein
VLGNPRRGMENFFKDKKIIRLRVCKRGRDARTHTHTTQNYPPWARTRQKSQASNKMRREESRAENVLEKKLDLRVQINKRMVREYAELFGERQQGPNSHTVPGPGAKSRRKLYSSASKGRCAPPPRGAGNGRPLGWAGPRISSLPKVRLDGVRLAAAGSAQQSRCGSLHPRSRRTPGTLVRSPHCSRWLRQGSAKIRRRGARIVGSEDLRYLIFFAAADVQVRSRVLRGQMAAFAARFSGPSESGDQLCRLTSLPSGRKISGKYRPARTIRRVGTGEEQRRGSVSAYDGRRISGVLMGHS